MNPDAPQQVFVLLLGLTAAGVVAATVVESGVLARSPSAPPAEIAAALRAPSNDPAADLVPDVVPTVDSEPLPSEVPELPTEPAGSGSGEAVAADGSGASADEPPVAEAVVPDPWEPLRQGTRATPCLVRSNRATMATRLERREPRGTDGPFTANGEPLVMFLDLANSTGVSQEITVVWRQQDSGATYVDVLEAGPGSRWRTWAERPLPLDQIGPWTVQVVDAERCLVDEVSFHLAAPTW